MLPHWLRLSSKSLIAAFGCLAVLAAVVLLTMPTIAQHGSADRPDWPGLLVPDSPDWLGLLGRDRLAFCVDNFSGVDIPDAVLRSSVQAALAPLASHPQWRAARYDRAPVAIDIGCPTQPLDPQMRRIAQPHIAARGLTRPTPASVRVTQPSKYAVYIYVLPSVDIRALFPRERNLYGRIRAQEAVCPGSPHECLGTDAVFVTPEQLSDSEQMTTMLAYAIHIQTIPTPSLATLQTFRGGSTEPPPWPTGVPLPTPDATILSLASRTVTPFVPPYASLPPPRTGPVPAMDSRLLTPVVFSSAQLGSLTPTPTRTGTPTVFPTRTMVPSR
jgi:hypothetical protein